VRSGDRLTVLHDVAAVGCPSTVLSAAGYLVPLGSTITGVKSPAVGLGGATVAAGGVAAAGDSSAQDADAA
jgi:hypothetical protein